jgi:hypothetical protein
MTDSTHTHTQISIQHTHTHTNIHDGQDFLYRNIRISSKKHLLSI